MKNNAIPIPFKMPFRENFGGKFLIKLEPSAKRNVIDNANKIGIKIKTLNTPVNKEKLQNPSGFEIIHERLRISATR